MAKRVNLLLCRLVTYDQGWFTQEALEYSDNSILYFIDFDKIVLKHKPDHITGLPQVIYYPAPKNQKFYSLTHPFFWAPVHILLLSFFFLYIALRFRPKIVWTDSTWVGGLWSIFKKLIGFDCFIYDARDWLASDSKQSFFSYFANNVVWPGIDYLATVTSDLQINMTGKVRLMRNQFWKKKVRQNLVLYSDPLPIKIAKEATDDHKTNICYVGQIRENSGLELLLPLMPKLYETNRIKLKIIGPATPYHRKPHKNKIIDLVNFNGFDNCVQFYDWIDCEEEFHNTIKDCFCGISLFTSDTSYSSMVIPGKISVYLQMVIPLLVTHGNGAFTDVIKKYELGYVIHPRQDEIMDPILNLYKQQKYFSSNIRNYAQKYTAKTVTDYINLASKKI